MTKPKAKPRRPRTKAAAKTVVHTWAALRREGAKDPWIIGAIRLNVVRDEAFAACQALVDEIEQEDARRDGNRQRAVVMYAIDIDAADHGRLLTPRADPNCAVIRLYGNRGACGRIRAAGFNEGQFLPSLEPIFWWSLPEALAAEKSLERTKPLPRDLLTKLERFLTHRRLPAGGRPLVRPEDMGALYDLVRRLIAEKFEGDSSGTPPVAFRLINRVRFELDHYAAMPYPPHVNEIPTAKARAEHLALRLRIASGNAAVAQDALRRCVDAVLEQAKEDHERVAGLEKQLGEAQAALASPKS